MADLEELERLARDVIERAAAARKANRLGVGAAMSARYLAADAQFARVARPAVILALLEERKRLRAALNASKGYMLNAKIDIQTGTKKATTINTLEGGLRMVEAAIAAGEIKPEGE